MVLFGGVGYWGKGLQINSAILQFDQGAGSFIHHASPNNIFWGTQRWPRVEGRRGKGQITARENMGKWWMYQYQPNRRGSCKNPSKHCREIAHKPIFCSSIFFDFPTSSGLSVNSMTSLEQFFPSPCSSMKTPGHMSSSLQGRRQEHRHELYLGLFKVMCFFPQWEIHYLGNL